MSFEGLMGSVAARAMVLLTAVILAPFFLPIVLTVALAGRMTRDTSKLPRLVWGPRPIISNKYWSRAFQGAGFTSKTLMFAHYSSINERGDYDLYVYDLVRWPLLGYVLGRLVNPYVAFVYALARFDVFHTPFSGGVLERTALWRLEAPLLKLAGKKVVILPYGSDFYMYPRVADTSLRHALLLSYPELARTERQTERRVRYWERRADAVVPGFMGADGLARWDALPFAPWSIDTSEWRPRRSYSNNDGTNGPVRVLHTPNHRGFKGTEFLVRAVEGLRAEGLKVELLLAEGVPNAEVRRLMAEEADILAEQFVATAYAMSGIEGMASGLPVMANLEHEAYTRPFRRWSYLEECPVLSTSPETLKGNLRALVVDPALREELGRAGRSYVEKYHSEGAARALFGELYKKVWHGDASADPMGLFHPLKAGSYNRRSARVEHPLVDSKLPEGGAFARRRYEDGAFDGRSWAKG